MAFRNLIYIHFYTLYKSVQFSMKREKNCGKWLKNSKHHSVPPLFIYYITYIFVPFFFPPPLLSPNFFFFFLTTMGSNEIFLKFPMDVLAKGTEREETFLLYTRRSFLYIRVGSHHIEVYVYAYIYTYTHIYTYISTFI